VPQFVTHCQTNSEERTANSGSLPVRYI
jgi:hypothetical protein